MASSLMLTHSLTGQISPLSLVGVFTEQKLPAELLGRGQSPVDGAGMHEGCLGGWGTQASGEEQVFRWSQLPIFNWGLAFHGGRLGDRWGFMGRGIGELL